ncbi:hypothetical protein GMJAKD_00400 [Candidatus Electrothrix aarhusensis]
MIGYHYKGMEFYSIFLGILLEPTCICSMIFLGNKAGLAIVATLDDMNRYAYGGYSWE